MDSKNPYTMAKLGLDSRDPPEKPERDCGFYAKYFFLFLSLIQFLIILGLVLFMVYGSPQAGNEKQLQGLSSLLQRAEAKADGLGKEVAELKRRLNASQTETALVRKQAAMLNGTLRGCVSEKTKLAEQQRSSMMFFQGWQECSYNLLILNNTCPAKVASLEDQLKMLRLQTQVDQDAAAAEIHRLQDKANRAEQEAKDCRVAKLQVQTREEKYRALESKVVAELRPVQQSLEEAVRRAFLPDQFRSCYQLADVCAGLSGSLQGHLTALSRQVEQKVAEVAAQNGRLEGEKADCGHRLQDKERQAAAQREQAEREKQALREAHTQAAQKAEAERSRVAKEKEELQAQLEHSKQACLRSRPSLMNPGLGPGRFPPSSGNTNPFGSFPGGSPPNLNPGGAPMVPNTFGHPPPWPRPGQPSSGSQGSPNLPERPKMLTPDTAARMPNPPPVGHPR
ncbi:plasmalemma vesicle-associated protein [Anolis carolinensis]|uniref:plasmalemma vesicle-associated protein n=1 Tax=Anolis carolinensis TaxID=28377 RepID=UPI002F2B5086